LGSARHNLILKNETLAKRTCGGGRWRLTVTDAVASFEHEGIKRRLSLKQLEQSIRAWFGRQRQWWPGGLPSRRPQNLAGALVDLDRQLIPVVWWYRLIT
jgi:hypothetical protein